MSICCTYALPPKASDHRNSVAREVPLPFLTSKHIRVLEVLRRVSLPLLEAAMWVAEREAGPENCHGGRIKHKWEVPHLLPLVSPMKHSYPKTRQRMPAPHVATFKVLLNRHNPQAFCPGLIPCSACTKAKKFLDMERAASLSLDAS